MRSECTWRRGPHHSARSQARCHRRRTPRQARAWLRQAPFASARLRAQRRRRPFANARLRAHVSGAVTRAARAAAGACEAVAGAVEGAMASAHLLRGAAWRRSGAPSLAAASALAHPAVQPVL